MIEKILKPKDKTFYPATVIAVNDALSRLQVLLSSGLIVWVDSAGLNMEIGDSLIVAALGKDSARFVVQKAADFMPAQNMTIVV